MTRNCGLCREGIASVSTPGGWLCKPCHREVRRMEEEDNPIANYPTCRDCGDEVSPRGLCWTCVHERLRDTRVA